MNSIENRKNFIENTYRRSGHKDVKMLKPYMAVVDEMRRREMSKFDAL